MYIPFHQRTTTGVLRSMRDRALQICSYTPREPELERLKEALQANGFPADLARKTLTAHLIPALIPEPRQKPTYTLNTPYVRGLSERFERVCTSHGICTAFKPVRTLKQTLMKLQTHAYQKRERQDLCMKSRLRNAARHMSGKQREH